MIAYVDKKKLKMKNALGCRATKVYAYMFGDLATIFVALLHIFIILNLYIYIFEF